MATPETGAAYRPARLQDADTIRALIDSAGLPARFVDEYIDGFVLAEQDGLVIGCGGLEIYETTGVLRSLVVAPDARGRGVGSQIIRSLEEAALRAGFSDLYLFTVDAWPFLEKLGYVTIPASAWREPARRCWQYVYVGEHEEAFRRMGLRSMTKPLWKQKEAEPHTARPLPTTVG